MPNGFATASSGGASNVSLAGNFGFNGGATGTFAGAYNSNFSELEVTSEYVSIKSNSPFTLSVESGDYFICMAGVSNGDFANKTVIARLLDADGSAVFTATTGYTNANYGIPQKVSLSGDYMPQVYRPDGNSTFGFLSLVKC